MNKPNPIFSEALSLMSGPVTSGPCRVTAELNAHESAANHAEQQQFDEWDDALMHDVMGNERLAKPTQALLIALSQLDMTKDSFGVNAERAMQYLYPLLKDFRTAVIEQWRDDQ